MAMKQTTKSLVTALAAVVAAGAVGLGALWVSRDETRKTAAKEQSAKLFAIDKDKARELRIEKGSALVAEVKRAGAAAPWTIARPPSAAGADADEQVVTEMIDKLGALRQKAEVEGMDPSAAGLDDDSSGLRITLVEDGGKSSVLAVGVDNNFDQTTYVKKGGEKIIRVIAGYDKASFEKNLFDLRDKRLARLDAAADVRKLEVSGTPVPYTVEKDAAGWKLLAPPGPTGPADSQAVDRAVNALRSARATDIAAESADPSQLKSFGLTPAKVAVKLTVAAPGAKDASVQTVLLGQPKPKDGSVAVKTYARRSGSPAVFAVDGKIVKDLSLTTFDLQDKSVSPFDREQVKRIDFATPGAPLLSIARKKGAAPDAGSTEEDFEVTSPQKGSAKKWKVSGALATLSGLRAAAFGGAVPKDSGGLGRLGLGKPRTITIFGEGDKVLARLEVGTDAGKDKKRSWVHAGGAPRVVEVEKGPIDDLPWTAADVIEPPPPAPPAGPRSLPARSLPDRSLPDGGVAAPGLTTK
jgi:Domain of unknown function (DUF4340)